MSSEIISAVIVVSVIIALDLALFFQARAHQQAQKVWQEERERLITAVLSRNVAEFAMAEAKMHSPNQPRQDRVPAEPPVGL
jgi:hypothetical protein